MEKYSEENTQYYMDIVKAISEHEDFGRRNPVDLGIECGFTEDDVLRTIERFRPQKTAETESENISDGGSASNSNVTLSGLAQALEEMNLETRYIPSFKCLGSSEDEARSFATVVVRAEKAGVELNKQNIDKLVKVTRKDRETVNGAIVKWLLVKFLYFEKHLSLRDMETAYAVQEALYNDDQKNDLDDVAKTTGIPFDVVQKMDGILSEFSEKNKIYDSIDRLLKSFDTIPREKRVSPEDVAIADMRELVRYLEKQVKGTLQDTDRQRIMQKREEYGKSIELLTEALLGKENLMQ